MYTAKEMLRKCYLVMQDVNHQLFCESVLDEVLLGAAGSEAAKENARRLMEKLGVWELRAMGKSIFIITHDRELIERCCTCELHTADGKANLYVLTDL